MPPSPGVRVFTTGYQTLLGQLKTKKLNEMSYHSQSWIVVLTFKEGSKRVILSTDM